MPDADLAEAIRRSQVADSLPDDSETDPDWLYAPDDTTSDQDAAAQRLGPNDQSLADYPSQPVAAATRDITPGVAPPESEYAGVAEDQAPKVVQPGAVASPLPEVLQPEYAGISPDQEGGAAPDIVPQVERGQLVSTPPVPPVGAASAEVTPGVAPPVTEPAPDTLTQVERATPVSLPPPQPVAQASRELALRAALMKLPPTQPVAAVSAGVTPGGQPGAQPESGTLAQVERGQLVDPDPDTAYLQGAASAGAPPGAAARRADLIDPDPDTAYLQGQQDANVPGGTIAQAPQGQARARLNPNDQSLDDYSKPVVAPPTPTTPVTGDLAQGPPGTHPAGTRDEPYWPKTTGQVGQLPPGSVYIDPQDGSVKTTPGKALGPQQPAVQQGGETGVANFFRKRGDNPITSGNDPRLTTVNVGGQNWRVNKEAAPYFQGFLNELAAKGAPIKALYPNAGWAYRKIAGTDTVSEHAYGGAIDVNQTLTGRNQVTAEFQKWMAANPGALDAAEKKWNIYGGERFGDLGHFEWGGVPFKQAAQQPAAQPREGQPPAAQQPAAQQPAAQPAPPVTTNPNGSDFPQRVQAVGNQDPAAFIMHHTSGRGTVDGVVSTLNQRGLGVQYVCDRDGIIYATGGPGAQNIKEAGVYDDSGGRSRKIADFPEGDPRRGLSNANIVGMEVIAKNDADVLPVQKDSIARFMALRYPTIPIFGHGEVNPGHKEDDEGQSTKAAALAYRDQLSQGGAPAQVAGQPGAAPQAQPVTKQANGLYQNETPQDFLTGPATTFATPEDIASGQDSGVGAPRLGKLDTTQVAGVAIPESALRAKYGNNYAAWRTARVDVVDTTTGKRLRLPVVDLVGADVAVDMTPFVSSYFGGDKTLSVKLVPNAGPDVTKNPQLFADEQAAIKQGIDSSSLQAGVQKIQGNLNYTTRDFDPDAHQKLMDADVAQQAQQRQVIAALPEVTSGNVMGAYNRLNNPIPGVSDAMRLSVQQNLKTEAIAAMQAKFPELRKSDADAWAQAQSPVGAAMAFPAEVGKQIFANYGKLDVAFNQMMQGADSNRMTQFAKILHPDYTPEGLAAFVKSLTDIQDPAARSRTIGKLWAGLDPQIQASFDVNGLVTAADNLSSPTYQKAQSEAIEAKRQYLDQIAAPDPRLKGTTAEWWAQTIGSIPVNVSLAFLPPGISSSLFAAQIYADTKDKVKAAHPDWSEAQVADMTRNSTIAQLLPQEALSAISAGTLGPLVERLTGGRLGLDAVSGALRGIENPALRAVTTGAPHVAVGAGLGAAQQIAANVAEGRPAMEGVGEAAAGGAIIGAPSGIIHGIRALGSRPQGITPPPGDTTVEPPLVNKDSPQLTQRPLTAIDVLGPEPKDIQPSQADDVLKVVAHNVFPDLSDYEAKQVADRVAFLSASNLETDRFRYELQRFLPQGEPYAFGPTMRLMQAYGAFKDGPTVYSALELQRAQQAFNEIRNPQVTPPGALHLPIMWRELEAQIPPVEPLPAEPPKPGEEPVRPPVQPQPVQDRAAAAQRRGLIVDVLKKVRDDPGYQPSPQERALLEEWNGREDKDDLFYSASANTEDNRQFEHPKMQAALERILAEPPPERPPVQPPVSTVPTQEDVARRAYELYDERTQNGQPGTALDDWTQAQKELSQGTEPTPVTQGESEPWVSALANRFTAERAASGEIGEVIPGEGYSREELLSKGLQMGPEEINQHVSDLMNNRGGDPKLQAGAIRAEEARLSQRSNAASRASEADPANQQLRANADNAFKDLTDFHNGPVAKLKNIWHAQGMTLQGEIPIDLSTFNGLREKFLKETGEAPPTKMEPLLRKTAKAVAEAAVADKAAMDKLGQEIERQSANRRLPTEDQVRNNIIERMKKGPCPT